MSVLRIDNLFTSQTYYFHWFILNLQKKIISWICIFHTKMCDICINKMKYFQMIKNILFHLYVHHMCFKHKKSMCKKRKLMKKQYFHNYHYQIMG
jgi:hypothetical protein